MSSPVSTCGVYSALCLPRRRRAISLAMRPRVLPLASTTYQSRLTVSAFALKVFILMNPENAGFKNRGILQEARPRFKPNNKTDQTTHRQQRTKKPQPKNLTHQG